MKKFFVILAISIVSCTGVRRANKPLILQKADNGFLFTQSRPLSGSRETVLHDAYGAIPQPDVCPKNVLIHPISVQNGYTFGWKRGIGVFELKTYRYWYCVVFLPFFKNVQVKVLKVEELNCCNPSMYRIVYKDTAEETRIYVLNSRGKYVEKKEI